MSRAAPSRRVAAVVAWAALAALWLPLLWRLHFVWASSADQAFGWAVPVLALYLATERWRDRPPAAGSAGPLAAGFLVVGALVVLLGIPVLEANLFWPRAQWWTAGGALLATAAALALAGGWRWSAHFWFPALFVTTALSWPTAVHDAVVGGLGGVNAWLAAEISSLLGRPALATGNVIEVGTGFVGVDEACSGLRSLQAVWMVAWCFGELFRLRWPRRLALVALALLTAFAGNVVRTVFLTWEAAKGGAAAVSGWHDPAGEIILVVTLAVVALLGWRASRTGGRRAAGTPAAPGIWQLPRAVVGALLVTGLLASAGTEAWYRWHEHRAPAPAPLWRLATDDPAWRPVGVPAAALDLLGEPAHDGFAWSGPGGERGLAYVFRWDGDIVRAGAAELHNPRICLPAVGAVLDARLAPARIEVAGRVLAFQVYRFDTMNGVEYVFFGIWDGNLGAMRPAGGPLSDDPAAFRLRLAWRGRRRADLAHVTFVTAGIPSDSLARDWLHRWAPRLLTAVR